MGNKRNTGHFFYNLLWNGMNDKIKGTVMIHGYKEQYNNKISNVSFVIMRININYTNV